MVYYLVYSATAATHDRTRRIHRLLKLGGERFGSTFWTIPDDSIAQVIDLLNNSDPIIFRKSREITKTRYNRQKQIEELGSLVLVQIKMDNSKREKIRSILRRIPLIRLSRSVLALPQRSEKNDPHHEFFTWQQFYQILKQMGIQVRVFLNMLPMNRPSQQRIIRKAESRITNTVTSIITQLTTVQNQIDLHSSHYPIIIRRIRILQGKVKQLWKLGRYYNKWLHLNGEKHIRKLYPLLHRLQDKQQRQNDLELEMDP